jgi:hypothetical protein
MQSFRKKIGNKLKRKEKETNKRNGKNCCTENVENKIILRHAFHIDSQRKNLPTHLNVCVD